MKQFENKVLFIKDEETLRELENMILDAGFKVGLGYLLCEEYQFNFLYFQYEEKEFNLSVMLEEDEEITLEQFKELLKQK